MTENTEEHWTTSTLRESLDALGVKLLTPEAHRHRWLEGVIRRPFRLALAMNAGEVTAEHIDAALDAAAGVLMELPRLEQDAWDGWKDRRLDRVFSVLAMAELPAEAPRSMLGACWAELRRRCPFEVARPEPGEPPCSFQTFSAAVQAYLVRVRAEVVAIASEDEPSWGGAVGTPEVSPKMLAGRLAREVGNHESTVRQGVLPLAHRLWAAAFAAQRAGVGLQRARGEDSTAEEGRTLRRRKKYPFHLAAWALRHVGLSRLDVGLFLHHVDPAGLSVGEPRQEPLKDGSLWTQKLEKRVDNSLAFWGTEAGRRGLPPVVGLNQLEREMKDLLNPVKAAPPPGYPPEVVAAGRSALNVSTEKED